MFERIVSVVGEKSPLHSLTQTCWPQRSWRDWYREVGFYEVISELGIGSGRMTGYSEVMDLSAEHRYRYLRVLAGNEEPVCQFNLPHQGVHPTAAKAGASPAPKVFQNPMFSCHWGYL
jgi:hypothetical protein